MAGRIKVLTGRKFNHWDVLNFSYISKKHGDAYWACRCDLCGVVYDVRSDSLQSGRSKKCRRCANIKKRYGKYASVI